MAEIPIPVEATVSKTRNSWLRDKTQGVTHGTATVIHEWFPNLSPNHLSAIGGATFSTGVHLLERENRRGPERRPLVIATAVTLIVGGAAIDGLDGQLSRIIEAETPGKHNQDIGQITDYLIDRAEEVDGGFARAKTARERRSRVDELLALAAAATAPIPGVLRAQAEVLDRTVPEQGTTLFEALGTRPGRVGLLIAAGIFPRSQGPIDALATSANINASFQRAKIVHEETEPAGLTHRVRSQARLRRNILAPVAIAVASAALNRARK